jgi:hypothetical protein
MPEAELAQNGLLTKHILNCFWESFQVKHGLTLKNFASSPKSAGGFGFREFAEIVIKGDFKGFVYPKTRDFSGGQLHVVGGERKRGRSSLN